MKDIPSSSSEFYNARLLYIQLMKLRLQWLIKLLISMGLNLHFNKIK